MTIADIIHAAARSELAVTILADEDDRLDLEVRGSVGQRYRFLGILARLEGVRLVTTQENRVTIHRGVRGLAQAQGMGNA